MKFPVLLVVTQLVASFALAQNTAESGLGGAAAPSTSPPTLKPASQENVIVYREPGRYGGWPANQGLWQWGDELVAGFTATY